MKLKIEFMGSLRRPKNFDRIMDIEVPEKCTLKQLLKFLEYSDNEIQMLLAFKSDGTKIIHKEQLAEGDSIFITIPIGGG